MDDQTEDGSWDGRIYLNGEGEPVAAIKQKSNKKAWYAYSLVDGWVEEFNNEKAAKEAVETYALDI